MKKIKTLFLSSFFVIPVLLFSREKITLAVLDFEGLNVDQTKAVAVTDLLRTELFNTGSFKMIERQKVRQIIEEQRFQASGITDTEQAVEIGRLLNVQKIMLGTVSQFGYKYIINTRILDVKSAATVLAEKIEQEEGEEELPRTIAELATTISFKVGLEGAIIRVGTDEIFMDLGSVDGVKLGQKFDVIRQGEVIMDLEGRVIGATNENIGVLMTTKIQDRFSVASIIEQTVAFRKGDMVRPASDDTIEEFKKINGTKTKSAKNKTTQDDTDQERDIPTPIF